MLGALVFDRDPLSTADLPSGAAVWFQVAGGFAFLAILAWLLLGYPRMRRQDREQTPRFQRFFFLLTLLVGVVCYIVSAIFGVTALAAGPSIQDNQFVLIAYFTMLTASGFFFVLAVCIFFLRGLFSLRWRRIYALSKLSFKEAVRRRILYAFAGILLVFLFATWFLLDVKPEDEVRAYVKVVFTAMALMLLPAAALVSAFSIPTDIKNQTIHTVVTKPVERFEIVLGRFLGYLTLMTLVLLVMTAVSLLYVVRGVNPAAREESIKARVPLYGNLVFEEKGEIKEKGVNVGREWQYRSYITKPDTNQDSQTARWDFTGIPGDLGDRDNVRFEYTFDIYRTTKGEKEGSDVSCTLRFYTWRFRPGNDEKFRTERGLAPTQKHLSDLAEKYGYYEIPGQRVTDYHTQDFKVPGGLFKNLRDPDPDWESDLKARNEPRPADLIVRVSCNSATQYVGMARYDLYIRRDNAEGSDPVGFSLNFFKAAFGLWLLMALVIGLCVVLSTYLSGVVSLLVVGALFFSGLGLEFIESVATGKNAGGGPAQSIRSIIRREVTSLADPNATSTADRLVNVSDESFRWIIRRILKIFPDVNRFFLTRYVAEGFYISWVQMGLSLLLLVGYLLPWFVLAYFLLRWREIAGPT